MPAKPQTPSHSLKDMFLSDLVRKAARAHSPKMTAPKAMPMATLTPVPTS